eukprot:TRINITY_DN17285_c0_g1_i2.p1 TRINITY_DN17285_c0_g1~~TRINITY_DN17285_c0_g1_i2.p1  ORF type:complete len:565 (-),score=148.57 TRINITY_DN17285_c0_g1_i2:20-1498(-)
MEAHQQAQQFAEEDAEEERMEQDAEQRRQELAQLKANRFPSLFASLSQLHQQSTDQDTFLEGICELLHHFFDGSACYIGRLDTSGSSLKYIAASPGSEFMLDKYLEKPTEPNQKGKGVTFDVFFPPQAEGDGADGDTDTGDGDVKDGDDDGDGDDGTGRASKKKVKDEGPLVVHVPNVLMGPLAPRVHFHKIPRFGSYAAVGVQYQTSLFEEALQQALAAGAGTGDDQTPPAMLQQKVKLAVCIDTLGKNRTFTDEEISRLKELALWIGEACQHLDAALVQQELEHRIEMIRRSAETQEQPEDKEREIDDMRQELGSAVSSEVGTEGLRYMAAKRRVMSLREAIQEFRTYNVFQGPMQVLEVLFYLLDFEQNDICDPRTKQPEWKKMRIRLNDELFSRINQYDPTTQQKRDLKHKYARVSNMKKIMQGLTYDRIREQNYPLAEIFQYVNSALEYKEFAKNKRDEIRRKAKQEGGADAANDTAGGDDAGNDED